jgi:hypothetical protein
VRVDAIFRTFRNTEKLQDETETGPGETVVLYVMKMQQLERLCIAGSDEGMIVMWRARDWRES